MPNAHAQLLARSHRTAVGVIVHDVSDPYFAEITRGLQRVATEHGRLVIICNSYRDPDRELEYVELLRAHQVAAIVLAGSGYHDAEFTKALDGKLRVYQRTGGRVAVIGRHELAGDAVRAGQRDRRLPARRASCTRSATDRFGVIAGPRDADHHDRPAHRAAPGRPRARPQAAGAADRRTPTSTATAAPPRPPSCSTPSPS